MTRTAVSMDAQKSLVCWLRILQEYNHMCGSTSIQLFILPDLKLQPTAYKGPPQSSPASGICFLEFKSSCMCSGFIKHFFEYEVLLKGCRSRKGRGWRERKKERRGERGVGKRGRELPLQNSGGRAHWTFL